jgi:predicted phage tail protein
MRRIVHLHGPLKAIHPEPIEVFAATVWDAVEAVTTQLKGFAPNARTGRRRIQVVGFSTIESLRQATDVVDIHILPSLSFGKRGLIQTIIGAALIVTAIFMGGVFWPALIASAGISMLAGGLMQMLSPVPQIGSDNADQQRSKYLNNSTNTVRIGTTIPLGYGRYRCGGQILSLNIDAKDTGL